MLVGKRRRDSPLRRVSESSAGGIESVPPIPSAPWIARRGATGNPGARTAPRPPRKQVPLLAPWQRRRYRSQPLLGRLVDQQASSTRRRSAEPGREARIAETSPRRRSGCRIARSVPRSFRPKNPGPGEGDGREAVHCGVPLARTRSASGSPTTKSACEPRIGAFRPGLRTRFRGETQLANDASWAFAGWQSPHEPRRARSPST